MGDADDAAVTEPADSVAPAQASDGCKKAPAAGSRGFVDIGSGDQPVTAPRLAVDTSFAYLASRPLV